MIGEGKYPESICEELLGYCLAPVCQMGGLGGDNMSLIIVCFLHGKPWETLVEKCKKIHADKKASTKLSEPAFTQFDRFTADGPFAEVSVLKASAEDALNTGDSTSSSSHTSPSSSPISTDEKFDTMLTEKPSADVSKVESQVSSEASEPLPTESEKSKETPAEATPKTAAETVVSNGE